MNGAFTNVGSTTSLYFGKDDNASLHSVLIDGTRQAQFYFFESEDDSEISNALFERVFDWAKARGWLYLEMNGE